MSDKPSYLGLLNAMAFNNTARASMQALKLHRLERDTGRLLRACYEQLEQVAAA